MIKCVAWDLDNTIWVGIADEGLPLELKPRISEILQTLNNMGIVNAIVSKNNQDIVQELIKKFKIDKYFLFTTANWKSKYSNIVNLSNELNISLDSILFVDDSEFELQEAKYYLPDIKILNAEQYLDIYDFVKNNQSRTKESIERNNIYRILQKRKTDEKRYSGTKKDFLVECNIQLTFRDAYLSDVPRIYELSSRTNQFNINNNKMQEVDIVEFIDSKEYMVKVCQLKDRYANYGIVGMAVVKKSQDRLLISHFAVSCKVEGRGVGKGFLTYLLNQALSTQYTKISSTCVFGDRNQEIRFLFSNLGFKQENAQENLFTKHMEEVLPYDDWLNVSERESSVLDKVKFILEELIPNICYLDNDDDLIEKNIIDSITAISLISALEERFDIMVEFEELKMHNFSTISKITSFVESKQKKGKEKIVL